MDRFATAASIDAVRPASDRALEGCPYCGCGFIQPRAWRELGDGSLRLKVYCPQCRVLMVGRYEAEQVERYDRSLVEGRRALVDSYERILRENLRHEAELLAHAFELDLIGADDFTR